MFCLHRPQLVIAGILCLAATTAAQDDRTKPQARPTDAATTPASHNDHVLASCLIVDNENEIALAELAKQRASSEEVKQFATRMITDHQQMISKLSTFTVGRDAMTPTDRGNDKDRPNTGADKQNPTGKDPTGKDPTGKDPTGKDPTGQNAATGKDPTGMRDHPMHAGNDTLDLVTLKRELGRKCLESAKKELMSKSGAEFDRCYMGQQIGAHIMVADELEVFRNYASEKLRQGLTDALPTVQEHLQHAKSIAEKLEGSAARPSK